MTGRQQQDQSSKLLYGIATLDEGAIGSSRAAAGVGGPFLSGDEFANDSPGEARSTILIAASKRSLKREIYSKLILEVNGQLIVFEFWIFS